jgi:5,10-methylenetetrahydromethanopterin reductase
MPLTIGVLLNSEYPATQLVELGQLCESLGYDQLWYTDVRLLRDCYVGLAALALRTERIHLGPGVTDPYSRHPAVTAATIATLDELSGGRALLGLGVGGGGFRELGLSTPLPVAALREAVDVVRRLLRSEQVTTRGKVISLTDGRIQFVPVRPHVPIYFATHGAQITKLAGEIADGVLIANTALPAAVAFYVGQLREGTTRAGRSLRDLDISLRFEVCIDDDEEAAFKVMRRRVAQRLMNGYPHLEFLERLEVALPEAFLQLAARKDARELDRAAALLPAEVVERTTLAGSVERVTRQIAAALTPEITRLTVRPHAVPGGSVVPVLDAFARKVMPRVTRLTDSSWAHHA